jgi:hypothetical protein
LGKGLRCSLVQKARSKDFFKAAAKDHSGMSFLFQPAVEVAVPIAVRANIREIFPSNIKRISSTDLSNHAQTTVAIIQTLMALYRQQRGSIEAHSPGSRFRKSAEFKSSDSVQRFVATRTER